MSATDALPLDAYFQTTSTFLHVSPAGSRSSSPILFVVVVMVVEPAKTRMYLDWLASVASPWKAKPQEVPLSPLRRPMMLPHFRSLKSSFSARDRSQKEAWKSVPSRSAAAFCAPLVAGTTMPGAWSLSCAMRRAPPSWPPATASEPLLPDAATPSRWFVVESKISTAPSPASFRCQTPA